MKRDRALWLASGKTLFENHERPINNRKAENRIGIIRRIGLTPEARIAVSSLSSENFPNAINVEMRTAIGAANTTI